MKYRSLLLCLILSPFFVQARPPILKGSSESLDAQNRQAQKHQLKYHRTKDELYASVASKKLVPVSPSKTLELAGVSFPFALNTTRDFLKQFSQAYSNYCQESLIVTSLTRPNTHQPKNASTRSVHPTGLAIDLRIPSTQKCKSWLVDSLVYLEEQKVVEATQERNPPHFHLVVFPNAYRNFVSQNRTFGKKYPTAVADDFSNSPNVENLVTTQMAEAETGNHADGQWIENDQELIVLSPNQNQGKETSSTSKEDLELVKQIEEAEDQKDYVPDQDDEDTLALSQSKPQSASESTSKPQSTSASESKPDLKAKAPVQIAKADVSGTKIKQPIASHQVKQENSNQAKQVKQDLVKVASQTPQIYSVKKGDNLWLIAKRHGVSVDQLMKVNTLKTDALSLNQKLKIPNI